MQKGFGKDVECRNKPIFAVMKKESPKNKRPGKGPLKVTNRKGEEVRRPSKSKAIKARVDDGSIRLNKYIANSGVCSRREADTLITAGVVTVNGEVVTELGTRVMPSDDIKYDGNSIKPDKKRYVLLNKPKNVVTSMDDPLGRRTVASLIKGATKESISPIGRLDRLTTGLVLFTNDGEMAKNLNNPKSGIRKIYHVTLKEKVKSTHLAAIREGVELDDGIVKVQEIDYVGNGSDPHQIGIQIHSTKNNIVARLFEHFGYTVSKLDRVLFAGLTKKDLPRGRYRHLTDEEVKFLKMIKA
jgi:23S rRNA pseudouridine2605 synthase